MAESLFPFPPARPDDGGYVCDMCGNPGEHLPDCPWAKQPATWRGDPRYVDARREALTELRHAIEQVAADQHMNAQQAMTKALLASQVCYGVIRHDD